MMMFITTVLDIAFGAAAYDGFIHQDCDTVLALAEGIVMCICVVLIVGCSCHHNVRYIHHLKMHFDLFDVG